MTAGQQEQQGAGAAGSVEEKQGTGGGLAEGTGQEAQTQEQPTEAERVVALEKQLADLRKEAGRQRTAAKATAAEEREQLLVNKFLESIGRTPEGQKKATAEDLMKELADLRAENSGFKLEKAVKAVAGDADPGRLMKHTDFLAAVQGLDPGDSKALEAAVKSVVDANPYLRSTGQVPGKSGGDLSGGTGEGTQSLAEQIVVAEREGNTKLSLALKARQLLGS